MKPRMRVALAGNPNCGKTTLFNQLTGSSQYVGNWPGVTVEKKSGLATAGEEKIELIDLPGIYSLSPYSPEEVLARQYLSSGEPEVILNIVDASNLERNLYLTTQLMELGLPIVIALNMMDVLEKRGERVDCALLSQLIGTPVVPISAAKGQGMDALLRAVKTVPKQKRRYRTIRVSEHDPDPEGKLAEERYRWIDRITAQAVKRSGPRREETASDRIDRIATHKYLGIPLFFLSVFLVFYITFGPVGSWLVSCVEHGMEFLADRLELALIPHTSYWVRSLLVDGIIAGVGAILKFLPQILLLFLLLSILEDSGYMARAAFIMDAPMRKIGLSGRAFVPLLMGFGCTVPAVMGTRILESEKDRRLAILITPFMSCSAKMPVYSMMASCFFGQGKPLVIFGIYLLGIILGLLSALLFKNTALRGKAAPFLMELPPYRMPTPKSLWLHVWERIKDFLSKAGTVILGAAVVIWALQHISPNLQMVQDCSRSILAELGRAISPIFTWCGFGSWIPAVSLLTGLVAKESIVSTMSMLGAGSTAALQQVFTPVSAISFLIFVLLYTPCIAAVAAIHREMGKLRWTLLSVFYQFLTAWYVSALFYQIATLVARFF